MSVHFTEEEWEEYLQWAREELLEEVAKWFEENAPIECTKEEILRDVRGLK